jgi:hypothetical protein
VTSDEGIRNRNFLSTLRRAGDQEVFPTDACNAVAPGNLFIAGRANDQWRKRRIAPAEFKYAAKR